MLVIVLTYIFSSWLWLRFVDNTEGNISQNTPIIILYTLLMVVLYRIFNLYKSFRFKIFIKEILQIIQVNTIGILIFTLMLYLLRLEEFSRGVLFSNFILCTIFISTKRFILRQILRKYRKLGFNQKYIIVVGSGNIAKRYAAAIKQNSQYGFRITGYVGTIETADLGKRLGLYKDLNDVLHEENVDEVIIALEAYEMERMADVINACEKQGIKTYIIPFYNDYFPSAPSIDVIDDLKLMNMRTIPLDFDFFAFQKRVFDLVFALIFIIISSPVMLIVAIIVKLSSPGPVIFRQERVGRNKKIFTMYKFRSMRINDASKNTWSENTDTRRTKFGSFIRKTSIDELPQFFNVLQGNMSLVGPRPELAHFVSQFKETIPLYMVKHQVRPGITGWAQVNRWRGNTSIKKRIEHDIWYIENWSILLDIKIVVMTIFGGLVNKEKIMTKTDADDLDDLE